MLVRHLADELASFRRRALTAEARLKEIEAHEGGAVAISSSRLAVTELEQENEQLEDQAGGSGHARQTDAGSRSIPPPTGAGSRTMTTKKHTMRVTILNEEYAIRSDRPPEHAKAVAKYFDQAIRKVMSSGGVVETNRAVVLAALQITAELFDAKADDRGHRGIDQGSRRLCAATPPAVEAPRQPARGCDSTSRFVAFSVTRRVA